MCFVYFAAANKILGMLVLLGVPAILAVSGFLDQAENRGMVTRG